MKADAFLAPFRKMKASAFALWEKMGQERTIPKVKGVVKEGWNLDLSDEDAEILLTVAERYKKENKDEYYAIGRVIVPKYTYVGFSTHGHCGGDVPLHAYGPGKPTGVIDGPKIGTICAKVMGLNLDKLNQRLFVEAGKVFGEENVNIDKSMPENPVLRIRHQGKTVELPVNKNWLLYDGKARKIEGIVVYAPKREKAYMPLQAINMIKGSSQKLPSVMTGSQK
jgi:alkaline phosphatase